MEMKYLPDGRKVAVLGAINNQEFIVQEIFVTGEGVEMAAGEKFTAKTLLDARAETYHQREERRIKESYAKSEASLARIRADIESARKLLDGHKHLAQGCKKFLTKLSDGGFADVLDLCAGKINWILIDKYSLQPPVNIMDELAIKSRYDNGQLRLLSILGRIGERPHLSLCEYSDGSGNYYPCSLHRTKASAIAKLKELALAKINHEKGMRLDLDEFEMCVQEGVVFGKVVTNKVLAHFTDQLEKSNVANTAQLSKQTESQQASFIKQAKRIAALES